MSLKEYNYNDLEENHFKVKTKFKEKGKEYGFLTIQKSVFEILMRAIELMSTSANISPKFSNRLESYLIPRFSEILEIITMNKALQDPVLVELSKENQKEVLIGLDVPIVVSEFRIKKLDLDKLIKTIKDIKMVKSK